MKPKDMLSENLHNIVCNIKNAILQSQLRAVKAVNAEQLSLYYGIGQYVSANSRKGFWGTGAIETISEQLRKELPGLRGFSATSIKKMRNFYEEWHDVINKSTATAVNLETTNKSLTVDSEIDTKALFVDNPTATAVNFNLNDFLSLGFSHHIEIINKTTSPAERIYYIHQAVQNSWSKYTLRTQLEADVYHRQEEYVEYVIQDYEKPMGVATYRTLNDMPEKLRKALPDMEELKKMI